MYAVYEVLDADGRVIYVGMTADLDARTKQHIRDTPGAATVRPYARYAASHEARAAEAALIEARRPQRNNHHNPGRGIVETDAQQIERLTLALVDARVRAA